MEAADEKLKAKEAREALFDASKILPDGSSDSSSAIGMSEHEKRRQRKARDPKKCIMSNTGDENDCQKSIDGSNLLQTEPEDLSQKRSDDGGGDDIKDDLMIDKEDAGKLLDGSQMFSYSKQHSEEKKANASKLLISSEQS